MPDPDQAEIGQLLVVTDFRPDGRYIVVLSAGDDRSWTLKPNAAVRYGMAVLAAAYIADYEQAVYHQLNALAGIGPDESLAAVAQFRSRRPPAMNHSDTEPLRFSPGLNQHGKGFIRLDLDDKPIGQLTPEEARSHGLAVHEGAVVAQLDGAFYATLTNAIALDSESARAVVSDIGNHRKISPL
jgi:hypothetical protein